METFLTNLQFRLAMRSSNDIAHDGTSVALLCGSHSTDVIRSYQGFSRQSLSWHPQLTPDIFEGALTAEVTLMKASGLVSGSVPHL